LIGVTSLSRSIAETVDADPPSIPAAKGFTEITSDDVNRAFQNLQPSPRLLLTGDAIANIQKKTADDQRWQEYYEALKRRADQNFDQKPVERIVTGRRLLEISRIALERIFSWSFLYRFTNDEKYAKRVEKEALAIARFEDWNPSHFLDVAEMTTALAIGYDTCKENFSEDNRRIICQAIRDKGVLESLGKNHGWKKNNANWNQVCWCGTLYGALAIADEEPELARLAVWHAVNGITWSMSSYEPDGNYSEGPVYWGYGTSFNLLLIAALKNALNNDFQRSDAGGLLKSIQYYEHVFGTTGFAYNYSDCGSGKVFEPTAFWFADKLNNPEITWNENRVLNTALLQKTQNNQTQTFDSLITHRLAVCGLLWGPEAVLESDKNNSENIPPNELGYIGIGNGNCTVALFRTDWNVNAAYLGIKAGTPQSPHGHMDEGTFVYDDRGVRWVLDLGPENYHNMESRGIDLWNSRQNSDRWKLFRYNNFGHSTLTINHQLQQVGGVTRFIETKTGKTGEDSSVSINLTAVYDQEIKSAVRQATLKPDGTLIIEDFLEALPEKEATVERRILTGAQVEIDNNVAILKHTDPNDKNKTLQKVLKIEGDPETSLAVIPATPETDYESQNSGISIIILTTKLTPEQKATLKMTFVEK